MAEEEKRVPNYNPEEDDKEYIGTKLLDSIERGVGNWYQDERTLEGWEYLNPFSVATATAIRGVEGVGWVLGNTPGASQLLQGIGWAEDRLAEGARNISGALTPDLDPRFAGWGSRLASAIIADKGIRKVAGATKATLKEGAERSAVRSGKKYTSTRPETMPDVWKDDLAGPRKTYERYVDRKPYPPEYGTENPMWMQTGKAEDLMKARGIERSLPQSTLDLFKKHDMRWKLEKAIDGEDLTGAPIPAWGKTGQPEFWRDLTQQQQKAEARLWAKQFAEEELTKTTFVGGKAKITPRVPPSKQRVSAYKFLGDEAVSEWNKWIDEVAEKAPENLTDLRFLATQELRGQVEHMIAKGEHMNWFWQQPNSQRLWRQGSRHGPRNVRVLLNRNYYKTKNRVEQLLYGVDETGKATGPGLNPKNPKDRFVVDIEDASNQKLSILQRNKPGDIVIKRASDGTVVGRFGEYLDVIYAPDDLLLDFLIKKGKIKSGLSKTATKKALADWRTNILEEKLNLIIDKADDLPQGANFPARTARYDKTAGALQKDIADFNAEYGELSPVLEALERDPDFIQGGGIFPENLKFDQWNRSNVRRRWFNKNKGD